MAEPILYHRAPAFVEVYARVLERLKHVFGTQNEVQVFTASGSGALPCCAVTNDGMRIVRTWYYQTG
jgi:aspartate aminotransferase-like enzyme